MVRAGFTGQPPRKAQHASIRVLAAFRLTFGPKQKPAAPPGHARFVAHAAVSTRLPLLAQSSHATVVAPTGVEGQRAKADALGDPASPSDRDPYCPGGVARDGGVDVDVVAALHCER